MSPSPCPQGYSLVEIADATMELWTRMYAEHFGEYGGGMVTSGGR